MSGNPFESGARKVIPAVLVYVRAGDRVLMLHKNTGASHHHSGKWNGLGGKLELDESPLEAAVRELREESGISARPEALRLLGVLQFPNFKAHKSEDWLVYVFTLRLPAEVEASGPEGDLHWIPARDLLSLNLWAGDRHFIPYVVDENPFAGTIWYRGQEVVRHWITRI